MPGIDPERPFRPLNIAILTVSDSRSLEDDRSGNVLAERLSAAGHHLADRALVRDEPKLIAAKFRQWIEDPDVDVVISTGGTGVTGRDVTPEALDAVIEKPIPGFGELFRMISFQKIGSSTVQSRAAAGVAKGTYLFALPARPAPVATPGTGSWRRSSTSATGPATSPSCCRACASTRRRSPNFSQHCATVWLGAARAHGPLAGFRARQGTHAATPSL